MAVDAAHGLDRGAAAGRPHDRVPGRDHERVAGDPDPHLLLRRERELRGRLRLAAGFCTAVVGRGRAHGVGSVARRRHDRDVDLVGVLAAHRVLDERRGRSRKSAWLTSARPAVSASATSRFVPGWPLKAALCIPGARSRAPKRSASTATTSACPAVESGRPSSARGRRPARRREARRAPAQPRRRLGPAGGGVCLVRDRFLRRGRQHLLRRLPDRRAASAARGLRDDIRSGSR